MLVQGGKGVRMSQGSEAGGAVPYSIATAEWFVGQGLLEGGRRDCSSLHTFPSFRTDVAMHRPCGESHWEPLQAKNNPTGSFCSRIVIFKLLTSLPRLPRTTLHTQTSAGEGTTTFRTAIRGA